LRWVGVQGEVGWGTGRGRSTYKAWMFDIQGDPVKWTWVTLLEDLIDPVGWPLEVLGGGRGHPSKWPCEVGEGGRGPYRMARVRSPKA